MTVVGTTCLTPVICSAALALPLGWRILARSWRHHIGRRPVDAGLEGRVRL